MNNGGAKMKKKFYSSVFELASFAVGVIVPVVLILSFGFRLTTVDGRSMEPTLHGGDRLLTTSVTAEYEYKHSVNTAEQVIRPTGLS